MTRAAYQTHRLLENSAQAFYWNGFLMAAGSFKPSVPRKSVRTIVVWQSSRDRDHLCKLNDFVGPFVIHDAARHTGANISYSSHIDISGMVVINQLMAKFGAGPSYPQTTTPQLGLDERRTILELSGGLYRR
jgi:hypothetical protein